MHDQSRTPRRRTFHCSADRSFILLAWPAAPTVAFVNLARDPGAPSARIVRPGPAARRVIAGAAGGSAAAVTALADGASWSMAALCASDVAALVFIVWVWITVSGVDAAATARIARAEDASRAASEAVLVAAGAGSLVAVAFTLGQAGNSGA